MNTVRTTIVIETPLIYPDFSKDSNLFLDLVYARMLNGYGIPQEYLNMIKLELLNEQSDVIEECESIFI